MNTIRVDFKMYTSYSKILEVIKYKKEKIIFTERSIIFTSFFPFTAYLKPYNYFISKKHGIIVQEKDNLVVKQLQNAYSSPIIICKPSKVLIGILNDFLVFYYDNCLILQDIKDSNNKQEFESNITVNKIVIYNENVIAISDNKIAFKGNNSQVTFNVQNKGNVYFEGFFLIVDNFVFYNEFYVGKTNKEIKITKFEEKILLLFEKSEVINFLKAFFSTQNNFTEVFVNFVVSKQTQERINNMLINMILDKNDRIFEEYIVSQAFCVSPSYVLYNLNTILNSGEKYKKIVLSDFIVSKLNFSESKLSQNHFAFITNAIGTSKIENVIQQGPSKKACDTVKTGCGTSQGSINNEYFAKKGNKTCSTGKSCGTFDNKGCGIRKFDCVFGSELANLNGTNSFVNDNKTLAGAVNYNGSFLKGLDNSFFDHSVTEFVRPDETQHNAMYNTIFDLKTNTKSNFTHITEYNKDKTLANSIINANETLKNMSIAYKNSKKDNVCFEKCIKEVECLLDENTCGVFTYDENDLEKKRKIAFINKIFANVGKSFFTYKSNKAKCNLSVKSFKPKTKSQKVETIEIEKLYKNWPDFIFMCNSILEDQDLNTNNLQNKIDFDGLESVKNRSGPSENSINKISVPFSKYDHDYLLAGALFGMGLKGKVTEQTYLHYYFSSKDIVVFAIIIAYCISCKGSKNFSVFETLKSNIKETDTYLTVIGSILGLGFLFYGSNRKDIANLLINECNKNGVFISDVNRNHKKYYDEFYRYFSVFSLSLVFKDYTTFIPLDNKMCELLLNGLNFICTRNRRVLIEFRRDQNSKYEEIFYSALFTELCMLETDSMAILDALDIEKLDLAEVYKISGKVFYIAFKELEEMANDTTKNTVVYDRLLELCLVIEEKMQESPKLNLLFDHILITLSIIKNGSFDLNVLRILRRLIKQTENTKYLSKKEFFSLASCKDEKVFGLIYGQMMKYKMCLGILCLGKGTKKLRFSKNMIRNTVISFFINFPLTSVDQEYFNVLRYFTCFDIVDNSEIKQQKIVETVLRKNSINENISEHFINNFKDLNNYSRKITLDILCDYFEKNEDYIDFNILPKFASDFYRT